jgi:hypothetical protein
MRTILLIFFILLTGRGFSQNIPIGFGDCEFDYIWAGITEPPTWAIDSLTIVDYFNQECSKRGVDLKNASGKVIIEIIIFENGEPCCYTILEKTSIVPFPYEYFKEIVDEMPLWNPGKQSGKAGIVMYKLVLELKRGEFKDQSSRIS